MADMTTVEEFCPLLKIAGTCANPANCPVILQKESNNEPEGAFCPACLRLRAWMCAAPDLLTLIDRNGYYRDVVPGTEVLPVYPPEQIIGKHVTEVGDLEIGRQTHQYALQAMDTKVLVKWVFELPERPGVCYEARFAPSGPDEALILIRDVTPDHIQREQLERAVRNRTTELQASNDELRQFAYAASHDLREPLGKIKAFGARLQERNGDNLDARGREYLGVMLSAADRMMRLIDDLLAYSRVGRNENEFEAVDLGEVISEVLSLFSERIAGAEIHCADDFPVIHGDRMQCFTLFQNIIGNSLKFKKPNEPAKIWITSSADDSHEVIAVRDEGIGFEPEYVDRIFLIFERLHTRFDYPGTGIGLALCRRIVERHGGFITAEGRPNEGSLFRVGFPRRSHVA